MGKWGVSVGDGGVEMVGYVGLQALRPLKSCDQSTDDAPVTDETPAEEDPPG